MDLIVKTQEKQVTITTVKGYLKAITSDDREIKFLYLGRE